MIPWRKDIRITGQNRINILAKNFGVSRNLEYGPRDPSRWPRGTLYLQKMIPTSPTNGGLSVSIIRSRTQATEFRF
jgi:hypothetical protein